MSKNATVEKKLFSKFEVYIRKDEVQKEVLKLRKKLNIPVGGLLYIEKYDKDLNLNNKNYIISFPERHLSKLGKTKRAQNKKLTELISFQPSLLRSKKQSDYIDSLFRLYVIFGESLPHLTKKSRTNEYLKMINLDELLDLDNTEVSINFFSNRKEQPQTEREAQLEYLFMRLTNIQRSYPVALFINPEIPKDAIKSFLVDHDKWFKKQIPKDFQEIEGVNNQPKQEVKDLLFNLKQKGFSSHEVAKRLNRKFEKKFGTHYDEQNVSSWYTKIKKERN